MFSGINSPVSRQFSGGRVNKEKQQYKVQRWLFRTLSIRRTYRVLWVVFVMEYMWYVFVLNGKVDGKYQRFNESYNFFNDD